MTIFNFQFSIFNRERGFTLIELMVVLSITAVLGTLGIAGFVNFNESQVLQSSTSEVVTVLNLAKSRAQSQIKPSSMCSGGNLIGYVVEIAPPDFPRTYTLKLRCSVSGTISDIIIAEENKTLPSSLSFSLNTSFFFPVQTGGVQASGQFVISNSAGRIKTVTVNSLGGVSVE